MYLCVIPFFSSFLSHFDTWHVPCVPTMLTPWFILQGYCIWAHKYFCIFFAGKILSFKSLLSLNSALPSFSDCPHHRQSRCPLCPRALAPIFPNPSQRIFLLDFALFEFEFIFPLWLHLFYYHCYICIYT